MNVAVPVWLLRAIGYPEKVNQFMKRKFVYETNNWKGWHEAFGSTRSGSYPVPTQLRIYYNSAGRTADRILTGQFLGRAEDKVRRSNVNGHEL